MKASIKRSLNVLLQINIGLLLGSVTLATTACRDSTSTDCALGNTIQPDQVAGPSPVCAGLNAAILCSGNCVAWGTAMDVQFMAPVFGASNYDRITVTPSFPDDASVLAPYDVVYLEASSELAPTGLEWLEEIGNLILEEFILVHGGTVFINSGPNNVEQRPFVLPFGYRLYYGLFSSRGSVIQDDSDCTGLVYGFAQPMSTTFSGDFLAHAGIAGIWPVRTLIDHTTPWASTLAVGTNDATSLLMGGMSNPRFHRGGINNSTVTPFNLRYNALEYMCTMHARKVNIPLPSRTCAPSAVPSPFPTAPVSPAPSTAPTPLAEQSPFCPDQPPCLNEFFGLNGIAIYNDEGNTCRERCTIFIFLVGVYFNGGWECGTCTS